MGFLAECRDFFGEFRRSFHTTGSLMPSSRFLARALAGELGKPHPPWRVLEVGPGTGAVTRELARRLGPDDRLDAVEINDRFVALLRRRLETDPAFDGRRGQVQILHAPVEQVDGEAVYDLNVSGLPLINFPVAQVRAIFRAFDRLLRPGGALSYFEYVLVRRLKMPFVSRRERRRLYRVGRVVGDYLSKHQFREDRVLANVPPAVVHHLRLRPAEPVAAAK